MRQKKNRSCRCTRDQTNNQRIQKIGKSMRKSVGLLCNRAHRPVEVEQCRHDDQHNQQITEECTTDSRSSQKECSSQSKREKIRTKVREEESGMQWSD